jgi:hypothetical protein
MTIYPTDSEPRREAFSHVISFGKSYKQKIASGQAFPHSFTSAPLFLMWKNEMSAMGFDFLISLNEHANFLPSNQAKLNGVQCSNRL